MEISQPFKIMPLIYVFWSGNIYNVEKNKYVNKFQVYYSFLS